MAADIWALAAERRYGELAELLGDLVPELAAAVCVAPDDQLAGLYELLAVGYQACATALAKLGEHDSALTAADRALTAAHRAGDLQAVAASAYLLVCILMETRRYDEARAIATVAEDALRGPAADGSMAAISLRGALTLLHASATASGQDPDDTHLSDGTTDMALSRDSHYLYQLNSIKGVLHVFRINSSGTLTFVEEHQVFNLTPVEAGGQASPFGLAAL